MPVGNICVVNAYVILIHFIYDNTSQKEATSSYFLHDVFLVFEEEFTKMCVLIFIYISLKFCAVTFFYLALNLYIQQPLVCRWSILFFILK